MKFFTLFFIGFFSISVFSQTKTTTKKPAVKPQQIINEDLQKINDSVPALIPQKIDGKYGYINQKGKFIISPQYRFASFFAEDCNLQNSPNLKVRKYGAKDYASVTIDKVDYRIDEKGRRVYVFKKEDLGKCTQEYKQQLYHSYVMNGFYGLIEDARFNNPGDYRQFQIYPQYQYMHVMEGDDVANPLLIVANQNRFGVVDKNNKVVIPFEYSDIKRNFSWKLARMFEVTKDGKTYYFIDVNNKAY